MAAGRSVSAVDIAAMDERRDQWSSHTKEIHCGWLVKRGDRHKSWKKRWFSIRGSQMLYYKDPADNKPLGVITLCHPLEAQCLREVRVLPEEEEAQMKRRYVFEIRGVGDQRVYYCSAADLSDLERWVDAIRRVIYFPLGGGMFGTDLTVQVQRERRMSNPIPIIIEACINSIRKHGLDEVGLFRLPGRTVRVRELKDAFNKGENPDIADEVEVHAVASLLKQYLRELPAPLLTFEKFNSFLSAVKIYNVDQEEGIKLITGLATSLPPCNAALLKYLCEFLREINERSHTNKMNLANLATVFAPNFLLPKEQNVHEMMENTASVHAITCILIEHQDRVFKDLSTTDLPAVFASAGTDDEMLPDWDSDDEDEGESAKGDSDRGSKTPSLSSSSLPPQTPTNAASTAAAAVAAAATSGVQGPVRLIQQDLLRERELRQALEVQTQALKDKCKRLEEMLRDEHDKRIIAESQLKTIIEKLPQRAAAQSEQESEEMFNLLDLAAMRVKDS